MEKLLFVLVALAILVWLACNTNKNNPPPPEAEESADWDQLLHDIWVLTNLNGEDLEIGTPRPQLELYPAEGRIIGQGSCNRLFGKMAAKERSITFSDVGTTKMHCGEYMERETKFLDELGRAERYLVRNGQLLLFWKDQVTLSFQKVD